MLHELTIENFALLEYVHLRFGAGLNVLTGETGAGKTIIIHAISRVLGSRASADDVRAGAARARIEAVFSLIAPPRDLLTLLADRGLVDTAADDGDARPGDAEADSPLDLILSREISASGRSVARVNGRAVALHVLGRVGRFLVDIHGQTEHLSLLRPEAQLHLLDRFAGLVALRDTVGKVARRLRSTRAQWQELQQDERELARRADLLRYQVEEIAAANLEPDEEPALRQERQLLVSAEERAAAATSGHALIVGGDSQPGALEQLGEAARQVAALAQIDPSLAETERMLAEAVALAEEVGQSLRTYADAVEVDPARLVAVEERLEVIRALARKYGDSIEAVLAYGEAAAQELANLESRDERLAELAEQVDTLQAELGRQATRLSQARRRAAAELAAAVARELADLNLSASFEVAVTCSPDPDGVPWTPETPPASADEPPPGTALVWEDSGVDTIEFRIAPNAGQPLRPVARIASGGEMSRILLALKSILSSVDRTPTLIFDEIDAGVGGRSGWVLGEKLARLGADHQVLCVTHLPQIAVYGQVHCYIAKRERHGQTTTIVRMLDYQDRLYEIAQMLGGATAAGLSRAREMFERGHGREQADAEPQPVLL